MASISRLSSAGTISAMAAPGWTTAPSVCTASRFTVPRTGARNWVRATRSSAARRASSVTARSCCKSAVRCRAVST